MVSWNSSSNREPTRRRASTVFPGRELPPPVPTVITDSNARMAVSHYEMADLHSPVHFSPEHSSVQSFHSPPSAHNDVAHKVWMLNCKHCGKFITNRGMKVTICAPTPWPFDLSQPLVCTATEAGRQPFLQ